MMQPGAVVADGGARFSVFSSAAEAVEVCLFDAAGNATARHPLTAAGEHWQGFVPGVGVGQRYGYRVHGPYDPAAGLRCNPHKLLLDPYARLLDGELAWHPAVFGYTDNDPFSGARCTQDSAPYVPKSVVTATSAPLQQRAVQRWRDSVICELNVRGYTLRHPALSAAERGRFAGLANKQVLAYLRALGITTVELMPVHAFIDERFLVARGLRNYWGYNSIAFFAPAGRYAGADPVGEFRAMTAALHDAGFEVLLDVVYNHTGETDEYGPTLGFRGLDNRAYYRTDPAAPGRYLNDTGCGNMLNADHPQVQALVVASLEYWHRTMGVDGFRFDLAPVLGRRADGFDPAHPLLQAIEQSAVLRDARLIAEPWDPGPGGYQLGNFGPRWAEWNDKSRDAIRRFWRGDAGAAGELARRLHGSAELFEADKPAGPAAGISYVTSHDGFTLADLVSYRQRHNEANGEHNRDGHAHNYSSNHGTEGPTDDPAIRALRRRQRLNMLATVLLGAGAPMLLAGDEFGHSQHGNNNAYAQDNELTWLDWSGLDTDPGFRAEVAGWIALRVAEPLLRPAAFRHDAGVQWLRPDGAPLTDGDWQRVHAFAWLQAAADTGADAVAVLLNAAVHEHTFLLPDVVGGWQLARATGAVAYHGAGVNLEARSLAVLRAGHERESA